MTEAQLQGFIDTYKQEFGLELSSTESFGKALSLLQFLRLSEPLEINSEGDKMVMPDFELNTVNTSSQ